MQDQKSVKCNTFSTGRSLLREQARPRENVSVCRICLASGCRLYDISQRAALCETYEILTGLSLSSWAQFPRGACAVCARRLALAGALRGAARRAHRTLVGALRTHGAITVESIQSALDLHGAHSSDVKPDISHLDLIQSDKQTDLKEQINTHHNLHEEVMIDIKVEEVMSSEVIDDESAAAGVDIASLQDDITAEVMAEHDDDTGDDNDDSWTSGLEVDVVDDNVGEDIKCEYKDEDMVYGEDCSSERTLPQASERAETDSDDASPHISNTREKMSCQICSFKAKTVAGFLSHMKSHKTYFNCGKCSYKTTKRGYLARHSVIHSAKKPYSCEICNKEFTLKVNLQKHYVVHSGEKPFSCRVCDKSFKRSDHLNIHLKLHSGERPHSCDICGNAFSTKTVLRQHLELHSGKKSFSCEFCGRDFLRKCNLQAHRRQHTGEKPYSCEVCGQKFSLKCNLVHHVAKDCNYT